MKKISLQKLFSKKRRTGFVGRIRLGIKKITQTAQKSFSRFSRIFEQPSRFFKKIGSNFTHIKSLFVGLSKKSKQVHRAIQNNKLLSNEYFSRLLVLCFFIGLNIVLFPYFLKTTRIKLPSELMNALDRAGIIDKDEVTFEYIPEQLQVEQPSLDPQKIHKLLNEEREKRELSEFEYNEKLASVAADLLAEASKYDYEVHDRSFIEELQAALEKAGYNYAHVSHNMVVGPLMEEAVIDAWMSNEQQLAALFADDFEEVGMATRVIETKHNETLGVVVQVLGLEMKRGKGGVPQSSNNQSRPQATPLNYPVISNEEVFEALNIYRTAHSVPHLKEHEALCEYAEKRVQDLIAFGSLDNHEGFRRDFENPETLPESIKRYPGKTIGENLAHQHCKNMTTGESFIAETGISIIEWCFDSSTLGHKEAQRSREYSHACVRSGNNMFVVIFGD